jgi:hypothetical protein
MAGKAFTFRLPSIIKRKTKQSQDENLEDSLAPPSLSVVTRNVMRNERRRNMSERAEPPTMFGIEFDDEAEYSDFVGSALHCFDTAEKSEYTNSEVIVQGLNFLIRASGLGNKNAMSYLHEFVHSLFPEKIPEDGPAYHVVRKRIQIVEKFLNFSREERRIWRCALTNFLAMSRDKKALPRRRFDEAVYNLLYKMDDDAPAGASAPGGESKEKRKKMTSAVIRQLLREALKKSPDSDEVIEEAYCLTVVDFTMGRLNVEFDPEDMTEEQIENFRKAPIMEKLQSYPVKESSMYILKQELPRYIDRNGMRMLRGFIPLREIFLLFVAFYALSMDRLFAVVSLLLFVPLFFALVVVTILLLLNPGRVLAKFEIWNQFLRRQQGIVVNMDIFKAHEMNRLVEYYLYLFFISIGTLLTFHGAKDFPILSKLFAGISVVMIFVVVFFGKLLSRKKPVLSYAVMVKLVMTVVIACKISGKIVLGYTSPGFLDSIKWLETVAPYVGGDVLNVVYVPLSLLHLVFASILLWGWRKGGKMHFHDISGPYLVTSMWWFLWMVFLYSSHGSEEVFTSKVPGLISSSVIHSFLEFTAKHSRKLFIGVVVVLALVCAAGLYFYGVRIWKFLLRLIRFEHLVMILPFLLVFAGAYSLVFVQSGASPVPLKWNDYSAHCGRDAWSKENMAAVQVKCSILKGRRGLNLSGVVDSVRISKQDNIYETVLNKLSAFGPLKEAGYLLFGRRSNLCDSVSRHTSPDNVPPDTVCGIGAKTVNLHHHNNFDVSIKVSSVGDEPRSGSQKGSEISMNLLVTGVRMLENDKTTFMNVLRQLKNGHHIRFNATYQDDLGSDQISMKLESLTISKSSITYDPKEGRGEEEKLSQFVRFVGKWAKSSFRHLQVFMFGLVYVDLL